MTAKKRLVVGPLGLVALVLPGHSSAGAGVGVATRANVLVVMTDDETVAEMRVMPQTLRLIGARGTTCTNSGSPTRFAARRAPFVPRRRTPGGGR